MLVRKVASAICRAEGFSPVSPGYNLKNGTSIGSGYGFKSEDWNEQRWQDYKNQAEAAILAIKEWTNSFVEKDWTAGTTIMDVEGNEIGSTEYRYIHPS